MSNHSSLVRNYLPVVRDLIRAHNLSSFVEEHARLFAQAKDADDHAQVATHYYDLMGHVIERAYGSSWIFCPPEYPGQSREQAIVSLHQRISRLLDHGPGKATLDMGCGLGGAARETAFYSGGKVYGVTLSHQEVERANALNREHHLATLCEVRQGNYTEDVPFAADSLDSAYSVYSLKYLPVAQLPFAFAQAHRVIKPGAKYVVYDAVVTSRYDETNAQHRDIVQRIEYSTGMPTLHTSAQLVEAAERAGLSLISEFDLSRQFNWNYFFVQSQLLDFLLRSGIVRNGVRALEWCRILPPGFSAFYETFLAGTVNALVDAGNLGIVSFSRLLVFQKPVHALHSRVSSAASHLSS